MLVDGQWQAAWQPVQGKDANGGFVRQASRFRNWITADGRPGPTGEAGFPAAGGRYHLYVAMTCPWAGRVLFARAIKRLDSLISVSRVNPVLSEEGWAFGQGDAQDPIKNVRYLHQIYTSTNPRYSGRATVPVLWDKQQGTIVNNESADILRMFNRSFAGLAAPTIDLYPDDLAADIDALNAKLYDKLNNGVYRAGFALTQGAYESAFADVFAMLDELEARLADGPYLFGQRFTESDIRLFVTLVRFDAAYHGLFKCNLRQLADYPRLSRYLEQVLSIDGVAPTVDLDQIKRGYFSIRALNPHGIVPVGPSLNWSKILAARANIRRAG
jgi:putative glutathione S-transferase